MPYFGPYLEPDLTNLSIWQWLFEHGKDEGATQGSTAVSTPPSQQPGFKDATTSEFISFAELKDAAVYASAALASLFDLQAGDTVAIVSRNSISYPVAMFAAGRLNAVVTLLPPETSSQDLIHYLRASRAKVVFTDSSALARVRTACGKVSLADERAVLIDDGTNSGNRQTLKGLVESGKFLGSATLRRAAPGLVGSAAATCAFLSFSSGTTGKPKAVMISHANVISQLRQMRQLAPMGEHRSVLGILPFYHITGLVHLLHLPLVLHQDLLVMPKFEMRTMMEAIVKYRCNELWLVPPLLVRLLNDPQAQGYDLGFVKQFNTGAAPLAEQIVTQLAGRFPQVALRQAWGMTESTSCLTVTPGGLMTWGNAAKVGKLVPGTEMRVVNPDTGKDVPLGHQGELWVRGPQVTMGYLDSPQLTADAYDKDGFLHTGDIGVVDAEGFLTIKDRIKEMIKVKGHGVAPAEIEDVLLGHPSVADAAVIGIDDIYSGELPRAYVVLQPSVARQSLDVAQDLIDFVKSQKPRHKWLAGGVEFLDVIPKSASGKILRRVLKCQWKESSSGKSVVAAKL
ncbi:hypothetical protein Micbo1qcDRAFT_186656 [Microdochium bolleyi]|uniref:4-coumarate-CoA ligase n=1 Tax=Microdochium bolleyi TaxID=196109 RepID=A0A136IL62_9PEZI|nr:hypothetical protein Micbo1qcDRAFT_186656 [Microdochium bolleyi]